MGSLFRSEKMQLCQLFLQAEAAYSCVSELGELGLVQFRDLNPDVNVFQRKFVNEVRRCDEMERKLRFLDKEMRRRNIPVVDTGDDPEAPLPREMVDLEANLEKMENELREVNANAEALNRNYLELTELKQILRKTQVFFEEAEMHHGSLEHSTVDDSLGLLEEGSSRGPSLRLGFVAGVLLRERVPPFERLLWRACRGNVFLRMTDIEEPLEDPQTGDKVLKNVFIIFFQGDHLKTRVKKICEGFRATLYPCPETQAERREMAVGVMTRLDELKTVLERTNEHRNRVLLAASKGLKNWFMKVRKMKAIYHTMNLFNLDVTQKCLIGECWAPDSDLDKVHLALRRGTEMSGSSVPSILQKMGSHQQPPTYHRTNKFTEGFQAIVDAYGVSSYREVNPAPFTVISFPFLFAVMFGDAGHGFLMFLFALWMVIRESHLKANRVESEIWQTIFNGRYIILLMGAFSLYTGLLYNDFFSKSANLFGSSWRGHFDAGYLASSKQVQLNPDPHSPNNTMYLGDPYPLGVDPIWAVATNKISFSNSLKMKMSIILGVTQMSFGVVLSLFNHMYTRDRMGLLSEFIPQMLFLSSIFVYLCGMVFYKWTAFNGSPDETTGAHCAPSLLIHLISMCMFKYTDDPCSAKTFYSGQKGFQTFLILLAVACIPWMLIPRPLRAYMREKKRPWPTSMPHDAEDDEQQLHDEARLASAHEDTEEHEGLGDVIVHQAIHTIEFVLGCVSHTASYLRLWALSLAHAQLSEVLWGMVLRNGLSQGGVLGVVMLVAVFPMWAVLTVSVLMVMEGLSAFLHALRLHWVEFQSKFYKGMGHKFVPFSFQAIREIKNFDKLDS